MVYLQGNRNDSSTNVGAIVGGALGGAIGLLLIGITIGSFIIMRNRRKAALLAQQQQEEWIKKVFSPRNF